MVCGSPVGHDARVAGVADEFRLAPEEDFLFGVRMRGSALSFGPAAGTLGAAVAIFLVMMLYGVVGMFGRTSVEHPIALHLHDGILMVAASTYLAIVVRSGVRADASGLTLRRIRRRHIAWSEIADVRAHETEPTRWRLLVGPDHVALSPRAVRSWSVGVVECCDGEVIVLPGFLTAGRKDGISLGAATAVEIKVRALRRFRGHVTGTPVEPMTDPTPLAPGAPAWWPFAAITLLGVVMWSLQSWAVGELANPLFLVIGLAAVAIRIAIGRRRAG